jgi:hypothetical protein
MSGRNVCKPVPVPQGVVFHFGEQGVNNYLIGYVEMSEITDHLDNILLASFRELLLDST